MLHFLPPWILGCVTIFLICCNTIIWFIPISTVTLFKIAIPHTKWQNHLSHALEKLLTAWTDGNRLVFRLTQKIDWKIQGTEKLNPDGSYLVISNHLSWIDILGLQCSLIHRIPPLKFFIKQELIWLPFIGTSLWALDFPMMKRYSPDYLKRHPELRGKDLETTRKVCRKLKKAPFSILNFPEGTRFSEAKQQEQSFSYRYLLKPRFGAAAIVLSNLRENLTAILDITIVYPNRPSPRLWDMLCGKVSVIIIHVRELPIPHGRLKPWVLTLWEEKDKMIGQILSENSGIIQKSCQSPGRTADLREWMELCN